MLTFEHIRVQWETSIRT